MQATYESRCPVCDEMIYEGDEIENHEGEWMHAVCADECHEHDAKGDTLWRL